MGETKKRALWVDFDRQLKLEFCGAKITPDAGLFAYRELDDAVGLTEMADDLFDDPRTGHNIFQTMTPLLPQASNEKYALKALERTEISAWGTFCPPKGRKCIKSLTPKRKNQTREGRVAAKQHLLGKYRLQYDSR